MRLVIKDEDTLHRPLQFPIPKLKELEELIRKEGVRVPITKELGIAEPRTEIKEICFEGAYLHFSPPDEDAIYILPLVGRGRVSLSHRRRGAKFEFEIISLTPEKGVIRQVVKILETKKERGNYDLCANDVR